jgi:hypothetical protein
VVCRESASTTCATRFAALLIAEGADAKAIQEAMGHSSITVMMNTYGHLMPRLLEEVADRLESSLFPGGAETNAEAGGRPAVDGHTEKANEAELKCLKIMVPGDGVEPPTRGFSVPLTVVHRPAIQRRVLHHGPPDRIKYSVAREAPFSPAGPQASM